MNRFRIGMNQRSVLEGVPLQTGSRHEEETVYFLNGLELKRPNIISRGSSKYRVIGLQQSSPLLPTGVLQPITNSTVSYIDAFGSSGFVQESIHSIPIELLSSEALLVSETLPYTSGISLAIEPTVVSNPIPSELPPAYDSTCVSQAISTPIVSSGLPSEYSSFNRTGTTTAYEVQLSTQNGLTVTDDLSGTFQILNDEETLYLTTVGNNEEDVQEQETQIIRIEPENIGIEPEDIGMEQEPEQNPLEPDVVQPTGNQMRLETQPDGTFVLYLQDDGGFGPGAEAIDLGSDAQIIQTDTFPVMPNEPFELPSGTADGQTESYILVPVDDQGNTVLVPTSSIQSTQNRRKSLGKKIIKQKNQEIKKSQQIGVNQMSGVTEMEGERPKPFRYELPEDLPDVPNDNYDEDLFLSMNMSAIVPKLVTQSSVKSVNMKTVTPITTSSSLRIYNEKNKGLGSNSESEISKLLPHSISSSKVNKNQIELEIGIEETPRGTFKCKFCSMETRLEIGILNHINRCHKEEKPFNCAARGQTLQFDKTPNSIPHPENCEVDDNGIFTYNTNSLNSITDETGLTSVSVLKSRLLTSEVKNEPMTETTEVLSTNHIDSSTKDLQNVSNRNFEMPTECPDLPDLTITRVTGPVTNQISISGSGLSPSMELGGVTESSKVNPTHFSPVTEKRTIVKKRPRLNISVPEESNSKIQRKDSPKELITFTIEPIRIEGVMSKIKSKKDQKKNTDSEETLQILPGIRTRSSGRCLRNSR